MASTKAEPSPVNSLNATDAKKIAKGAAIAFGAAFLYSVAVWLSVWTSTGTVNWSTFGTTFLNVCIPAALSTGINALMKFFQGVAPQQ
jgi:hypothetical protein